MAERPARWASVGYGLVAVVASQYVEVVAVAEEIGLVPQDASVAEGVVGYRQGPLLRSDATACQRRAA